MRPATPPGEGKAHDQPSANPGPAEPLFVGPEGGGQGEFTVAEGLKNGGGGGGGGGGVGGWFQWGCQGKGS